MWLSPDPTYRVFGVGLPCGWRGGWRSVALSRGTPLGIAPPVGTPVDPPGPANGGGGRCLDPPGLWGGRLSSGVPLGTFRVPRQVGIHRAILPITPSGRLARPPPRGHQAAGRGSRDPDPRGRAPVRGPGAGAGIFSISVLETGRPRAAQLVHRTGFEPGTSQSRDGRLPAGPPAQLV